MPQHAIHRITRRALGVVALAALTSAAQLAAADILHDNENITTSTVWSAGEDHVVIGTLAVRDTLTIEDGCVVRFESGGRLYVFDTLVVDGSTLGVLFTRRDPGDTWYGVYFNPNTNGSIHGCTIEYASLSPVGAAIATNQAGTVDIQDCTLRFSRYGLRIEGDLPTIGGCTIAGNTFGIELNSSTAPALTQANSFQTNYTGIVANGCTDAVIDNQTITGSNSADGAILIQNSGEFTLGPANAITGNSWGLSMDLRSYPSAASDLNLPVAGNTNDDGVQIRGSASNDDTTWRALGADYIVTGNVSVGAGTTMSIESGTNFRFMPSLNLSVYGTLTAQGTPQQILFTKRQTFRWAGLRFLSGSTGNLFNCRIDFSSGTGVYATGANMTVNDCELRFHLSRGIRAEGGSHATLSGNSFIQNGTGASFYKVDDAVLELANDYQDNGTGVEFDDCTGVSIASQTISGSTSDFGAVFVKRCGDFHFGPGNDTTNNSWGLTVDYGSAPDAASAGNLDFSGNSGGDVIQLRGNAVTDATFRDLGLDYVGFQRGTIQSGATMTIEPGVNMRFGSYGGIIIQGTLDATSAGAAILFDQEAADGWQGLLFSNSGIGMLENCVVYNATGNNFIAGVEIGSNASVQMTDCLLTANSHGLRNHGQAGLVRCSVTGNLILGVEMMDDAAITFGGDLSQWNAIYGNGIGVDRDFQNATHDVDAPFVFWGSADVDEIEDRIHHEPDDPLLGRVDYRPFTDSTHTQTFGLPFSDVTPLAMLSPVDAVGAAWGDYDDDGDPDLFVSGLSGNRLFENFALNFVDVTPSAVANTAPGAEGKWVDIDEDGDLDLAVANPSGPLQIVFREETDFSANVTVIGSLSDVHSIEWADMDHDGDMDAIAATVNGGLQIYTKSAGFPLFSWDGLSFGPASTQTVAFGDYDGNGTMDIAASGSDSGFPQTNIYYSSGSTVIDNPYTLVLPGPLSHTTAAWADPDGDGDLDLFVGTEDGDNVMACSIGGHDFYAFCSPDLSADTGHAVSASWADLDNDGLLDLYLANDDGNNRLYTNLGGMEFGETVDPALAGSAPSGAAAWADYDGDGDLDLFIASTGGENRFLRNDLDGGNGNHWFQVDLAGIASTRFGEGSRIEVSAGGVTQAQCVGTGAGAFAQNSVTAEFGLGAATTVDLVTVRWSSGAVNAYGPFAADQRVTLTEQIFLLEDTTAALGNDVEGSSWGDFDNDGDDDLYVHTQAGMDNRLYRNDAGTLVAVTGFGVNTALASTGSAWGDYDGDGWLDLVVTGDLGVAGLYHNEGGADFSNATSFDLSFGTPARSPTFFDYDGDGDLDLHVSADSNPTRLFRNDQGLWIDVTAAAGDLYEFYDESSSAWGDFDDDGDLDVFSCRGAAPGTLLRNDDGIFVEFTPPSLTNWPPGYQANWIDVDNDGDLDLHTSGLSSSQSLLFRNDGGDFIELPTNAINQLTRDALWYDVDLDGDLDFVRRNGLYEQEFVVQGAVGFNVLSVAAWPLFAITTESFADLDGDGALDCVATNAFAGSTVRLLRSPGIADNHWLRVRLQGTASNPQGIGARILATTGAQLQRRDVVSHGDRGSTNSLVAHFGLGSATQVDQLEIRWPSGIVQTLSNVPADQLLLVTEDGATAVEAPATSFALEPGFPNPMSSSTSFAFGLPKPGQVQLRVYDLAGRLVDVVADRSFPAGRHVAAWDGRDVSGRPVASGTYFLQMRAGSFESSRSVVLIR